MKAKFGIILMVVWLIFYVAYNTYFGWNQSPQSELEKIFDSIVSGGLSAALIIYFWPLLTVYNKWLKDNDL